MDIRKPQGEYEWRKTIASWDARRVIRMWKLIILCGAFLCLSLTATANDSAGALDASSSASAPAAPAPISLQPSDRQPWQVGVGFKYQHLEPYGLNFYNLGFNADITRYVNNWLGVEGGVVTCFGHTGPGACSIFVGGGPHIVVMNKTRLEPWVHVLLGMEHFRFTQTSGLGSNTAFGIMAGGGVDVKIKGPISWRVQGDYLGTHFQSTFQTNYSFGTGLVISW
jgi:hypothetical protein